MKTFLSILILFSSASAFMATLKSLNVGKSRPLQKYFAVREDDNGAASNQSVRLDTEFWDKQKQLALEMSEQARKSVRTEQLEKFSKRRLALVGDTAYFGFFTFCALWTVFPNPFVAFSYALGATLGLAYSYGLGKYVETLGGNVEDGESLQGAGVGEARFAFLILLFVFVGRFRSAGLLEIPAIAGFFTYQLATLSQGLREIND